MPELRQNIATREWVIIATERAKRPDSFLDPERPLTQARPPRVATCPFCPGNEKMTGTPSFSIPMAPSAHAADENSRWAVRIVPNKFAALDHGADLVRVSHGVERMMHGFGVHEVLVESPLHNTTTALQTDVEVYHSLYAFRERGKQLARDSRVMLTIYFKNHGASAGTSQEHPHCQLIAVPVVPHSIRVRLNDALAYFDEHGRCAFCDMVQQEVKTAQRVIREGKHFVSFIPYAALSPFHIWIVPRRHMSLYTQSTDAELEDLAMVLRDTLARLYTGLRDPDYNFAIRTAPNHEPASRSFHWYLSVVPKVSKMAGFEMGSGMFINTALPEHSARFLRDVKL